jgi:hypothetical protein
MRGLRSCHLESMNKHFSRSVGKLNSGPQPAARHSTTKSTAPITTPDEYLYPEEKKKCDRSCPDQSEKSHPGTRSHDSMVPSLDELRPRAQTTFLTHLYPTRGISLIPNSVNSAKEPRETVRNRMCTSRSTLDIHFLHLLILHSQLNETHAATVGRTSRGRRHDGPHGYTANEMAHRRR